MRGTSWLIVVLVIVFGSILGVAGGTFLAVVLPSMRATGTGLGDMMSGPFHDQRYVRILMMGEDDTSKRNSNGYGLSDTLVVMAIDTQTKDIRAISIPRDTMVEIPGHGTCKINSANVHGGPELAKQVVQSLIGVPIDYYVMTNTGGLRGMVDLLGGIYVIVDKDMHYTDRHGGLYINLHASPEKQLLNGKQAEGFVRFRHDAIGDSGYTMKDGKRVSAGRIVRQQLFMRSLANRVLSLPTRRERADFLRKAYERKYIISNLKMRDWDGLSEFMKDFKPEEMAMDVLPGGPQHISGASYWVPDMEAARTVIAQNMLFQGSPGQENPKIEVLNGSGISGIARRAADKLKDAGFEVERYGNAPRSDYVQSCIITHKGKIEPVQRIAKLLNCEEIREESGSSDGADVTVIVGRNYSD
ncbi:MAG: LCP family protein [Armatimonadota bacterium]|nr:LCP family protein [bacterium]